MQAGQNQNVLNSVHQVVQSNVSKMYKKIDDIIQSAKSFVEEKPQNGQKIVDHVTSYTKYMHKVIEQIIQSYSVLLESAVFGKNNPMNQILPEEMQSDSQQDIAQLLQNFKTEFAQNIERAKNATNKIQSLLTPLVQ
jgi:hypothetical protein